jgi:RNA polymerase sigma-70 factor, ECF subfamily
LFDFHPDRLFAQGSSPRVVALRQAEQRVETRQRDIYDSHRHRTFALAYYMTGSEVEAEQILTSTFVRAFNAAPEPEGSDIDSALLEELRQRFHFCFEPAVPLSSASDSADSAIRRNLKRTDLEEALWNLPSTQRLLFLLRDVEGYAPAAIAKLLDMPESQVQRGLLAARIQMRRALSVAQNAEEKAA